MKKHSFLNAIAMLACTALIAVSCNKVQTTPKASTKQIKHALNTTASTTTGTWIKYGVNQPNGGCDGSGSECKLTTITDPIVSNPPAGGTWGITSLDGNNHLVVAFAKEFMDQQWKDLFSEGIVSVGADNTVGSEIMTPLTGVPNDTYIITEGSYSYTEDANYYYVTY